MFALSATGTVVFVGRLRGIDRAIVVRHSVGGGRFWSILGHLTAVQVAVGEAVSRGQILAESSGERVYLELRMPKGGQGFPVDPAPLIGP